MSLFVATHRHTPEHCPASFRRGAELLSYVSAINAARYGVTIQSEAIIDGEHRLILILQATERAKVERFLAFFSQFGSVELLSASSSDTAVARGCCAAVRPQESPPAP